MSDLIAHSDGRFVTLTNGRMHELIYHNGTQRKWMPVDAPFTPTKLALRGDGNLFAADDAGALWQRLPDHREHVGGEVRITPEWRRVAGAPPA